MAGRITCNIGFRFERAGLSPRTFQSEEMVINLTGNRYFEKIAIVDVTASELTFDGLDLIDIGFLWLKNLDASNFILIGNQNNDQSFFAKLDPLKMLIFPSMYASNQGKKLYVKANAAPCELSWGAFEK